MTQTRTAEPKQTYMQRLDDWSNDNVINPIWDLASDRADDRDERDEEADDAVLINVRKAIREKVLQSFRNGQRTGPRKQK